MQSNLFIELAEEQQEVVTGGGSVTGGVVDGLKSLLTSSVSSYSLNFSFTGPSSVSGPLGSFGKAADFSGANTTSTENILNVGF